jgi:hypothetical protein
MNTPFKKVAILAACLIVVFSTAGRCQEKDKNQTGKKTVSVTKDKKGGLTIIKSTGWPDDRFLITPKKYINIQFELLEIKPSETISLEKFGLRAEEGTKAEYVQGGQDRLPLEVNIVPSIIEGKGVRLKIDFMIGREMKSPKTQEILVPNAGSMMVELLENKAKGSRIALRLTPIVEIVEAAKEYPGKIRELALVDSFLVLNDDKLVAHNDLMSAKSDSGADIYLFFYCTAKGVYVLSFKPAEGFTPAGVVSGKTLTLKLEGDTFDWYSSKPILPEGNWLVWARRNPRLASEVSVGKGETGIMGKNGLIGIGVGQEMWKKYFK